MSLVKRFGDLRFVIGVFFGIVGVILLVTGATDGSGNAEAVHLNLVSGGAMIVLAGVMLSLAILRPLDEQ